MPFVVHEAEGASNPSDASVTVPAVPVRVHSALVPQPYNHTLEKAAIPDHEDVVKAVLKLFGKA